MLANSDIKILIVDDSKDTLSAIKAVLSEEGYTIIAAESGHIALRYLLDQEFALILLDVVMPQINGFELASMIQRREKSKDVPIIFLTATDKTDAQVFKGYSAGAVDYLFKPLNIEILKSKVSVF